MMNATQRGRSDAGNPHGRFYEAAVAPAKTRRRSLLYKAVPVLAIAVSAAQGWSADVAVGFAETTNVTVNADTTETGEILVAPRGTICKDGAAKWTVPSGQIRSFATAKLVATDGTLAVTETTASAPTAPAVLERAAVWFDSKNSESFVTDSSGNITDWLDTRETGTATTGYTYNRAVSEVSLFELAGKTKLYPVLQEDTASGKRGLYFHGVQSGCWMKFMTPKDVSYSCFAYNVFAVHGVRNGLGNVLGVRKSFTKAKAAFIAGNSSTTTLYPLWIANLNETPAIATARTYVNGEYYDGRRNNASGQEPKYPTGFTLLEAELLKSPGEVSCFYNDRGYAQGFSSSYGSEYQNAGGVRLGGDYIGEVVLFTNRLTTAERLAVEQYLMHKWFGAAAEPKLDLVAAKGAIVEVPVAFTNLTLSGSGLFVKNDEDKTPIAVTTLQNFSGAINLGTKSEVWHNTDSSFALEAGRKYYAGLLESKYDIFSSGRYVTSRVNSEANRETTCIKYGPDELKVSEVSGDITRLQVQAGTLRFEPTRLAGANEGIVRHAVIVPNASFEDGMSTGVEKILANGAAHQGWHCVVPTSSDSMFIYNKTIPVGTKGTHRGGAWGTMPDNVPDGNCGLGIQRNASAWTEITIPEDGTYRFSVRAASRRCDETGQLGHAFLLQVGPDADHLTTFGHLRTVANGDNFWPYSYRMGYLTKGTYQLWISGSGTNPDRTTIFDCVKIAREEADEDWLLPNGNFEDLASGADDFPNLTIFTNANSSAVLGWTLVDPDGTFGDYARGFSHVAPATPIMSASSMTNTYGANPGYIYNMADGDGTPVNLELCLGGTASCTFTPPKGVWKLRVDATMQLFYHGIYENYSRLFASVTQDGTTTQLGYVNHLMTTLNQVDTFPTAMTFDGETEVTITLWCEKTNSGSRGSNAKDVHFNLDNVRLTPLVANNLISNGGFENTWTSWTQQAFSTNKWGLMKCEILNLRTNSNNIKNYGANPPAGNCALRLLAEDIVKQTITFPEAGTYEFSAWMRTRVQTTSGLNPVRVWYAANGVTNEIVRSFTPNGTNFVNYAWNFEVAQAGTYEFGLEGLSVAVDRSTLVDEVTVKRVYLEKESPTFNPELVLMVSEGAKLNLDYPGVADVARVYINGARVKGEVSAATHPDVVSGMGKINAGTSSVGITIMIR